MKQCCPLSPLLVSLYINDVDEIAESVQGDVTSTTGSSVTHMLYADDLTLMANDPDALRTMLNRLYCMLRESTLLLKLQSLRWFISIHLVQMCLCSTLGECRLHTKILLSIWVCCLTGAWAWAWLRVRVRGQNYIPIYEHDNYAKHAAGPFMASAFRVCQFVLKNWLRKA